MLIFDFPKDDKNSHHCTKCYTALFEDDLFVPKGLYMDSGGIPMVFNSMCTITITPYKDDVLCKIAIA